MIRMVSELHRMGYQRLRIMPYEHPLAWRLAVGPADQFSSRNGAFVEHLTVDNMPIYSSAQGVEYFQWEDASFDNARQLAEKFRSRFPEVCEAGRGSDWAYAGWLSELLGTLEQTEALPIVMEEFGKPPLTLSALPLRRYGGSGPDTDFSLPPPGYFKLTSTTLERTAWGASTPANALLGTDPVKDLRQFGPVASVLGVAMGVGVHMFDESDDDASHELLLPIAAALAGNDAAYRVDGRWCQLSMLGAAIKTGFDLPPNFIPDETLEAVVLFGLEHVTLAVKEVLKQTEQQADWDQVTAPRLMEIHAYATCVFLGTAAKLYPRRTLVHLTSGLQG